MLLLQRTACNPVQPSNSALSRHDQQKDQQPRRPDVRTLCGSSKPACVVQALCAVGLWHLWCTCLRELPCP